MIFIVREMLRVDKLAGKEISPQHVGSIPEDDFRGKGVELNVKVSESESCCYSSDCEYWIFVESFLFTKPTTCSI